MAKASHPIPTWIITMFFGFSIVLLQSSTFAIGAKTGAPLLPSASIPQMEMNALQEFYDAMSGPDWVIFGVEWNFTGLHNPCAEAWEGIECTCMESNGSQALPIDAPYLQFTYDDGVGSLGVPCHISKIFLGFCLLQGTLPSSLGDLLFLTKLHMEYNRISGGLPSTVGSLKELQFLVLFANSITGPITPFLGHLTNMKGLALCENLLTGPIPSSIGQLVQLQDLIICENSLTNVIPTSVGKLVMINQLNLDENYLSGDIPSSIGQLTDLIYMVLSTNLLSGSIPTTLGSMRATIELVLCLNRLSGAVPTSLGNMTALQTLYLYSNYLTGSIPTSLGNLESVIVISLFNNSLTGTIPASFGHIPSLGALALYNNSLSGTIPTTLGCASLLTDLYLATNSLSGSIPTVLGLLSLIQDLDLYSNRLTGSIPTSLGNLNSALSLELSNNCLTSSIPSSLGRLGLLQYLWLCSNSLTGSVPSSLGGLNALQQLLLYSNSLSGDLNAVFGQQNEQYALQVVDVSVNQLTGSLPQALFTRNITTLAMVQNCFSGTFPLEVCQAMSLKVLALDGLHTAPSCRDRFFPSVETYALQPSKSMQGTIPACYFNMPNLTTLHLSGNGLSGTIPASPNVVLTDLSLANNILIGSIPQWVQDLRWENLNLAYNRFSGTLGASLRLKTDSSLALNVNRLSGKIPSSLKSAQTITILQGNLFNCNIYRDSLPTNDPDVTSYQCASKELVFSLMAWSVVLCCCLLALLIIGCCRSKTHENVLKNTNFFLTSRTLKSWIERMIRQGMKSVLPCHTIRLFALTVSLLAVCILMPTYAALSTYFRNYENLYGWVVSASYMSGSVPAAIVVVTWTTVGVGLSVTTALLCPPSTATGKNMYGSRSWSHWINHMCCIERSRGDGALAAVGANHSPCIWLAFVVANLAIMGSLNAVYVLLVTSSISTSSRVITGLEVVLGIIKGGWNGIVLPRVFIFMLRWQMLGSDDEPPGDSPEWMVLQLLVVINNIVLPCVAVALVDSNCFYYMVKQAPLIDASYSYDFCSGDTVSEGCTADVTNYVTLSFPPPFIYNYQCSSALLSNYAPVYIYSMIFISFVSPVMNQLSLSHGFLFSTDVKPHLFMIQITNLLAILVTFGVVFPPLAGLVFIGICVETFVTEERMAFIVTGSDGEPEIKRERMLAMEATAILMMETFASSLWLLLPLSAAFNSFFVFDLLGGDVGWEVAVSGLIVVALVLPLLMWGCYGAVQRFTGLGHNRGADDIAEWVTGVNKAISRSSQSNNSRKSVEINVALQEPFVFHESFVQSHELGP